MMRMGKRSVDTDTAESADRIYRSLMKKRQTASMMRMGKRGGKYYGRLQGPRHRAVYFYLFDYVA